MNNDTITTTTVIIINYLLLHNNVKTSHYYTLLLDEGPKTEGRHAIRIGASTFTRGTTDLPYCAQANC